MDRQLIKKILKEARSGMLNYLRKSLPNFPEYVLKDFVYPTLKNGSVPQIQEFIDIYKTTKWELKKDFPINKNMISPRTLEIIHMRQDDDANPFQIPRDPERHKFQRQQILKKGLPQEPIIMFLDDNGKYELVEGWHRTIQLLKLFPEGYRYPNVWIGFTPDSYDFSSQSTEFLYQE